MLPGRFAERVIGGQPAPPIDVAASAGNPMRVADGVDVFDRVAEVRVDGDRPRSSATKAGGGRTQSLGSEGRARPSTSRSRPGSKAS